MASPLDALTGDERALLRRAHAPREANAMKAVLTEERFSDPAWIFERKLDGVRCVAIRDGHEVRLLSRNDLSLNGRYPEVAHALAEQRVERFAVDGEVVAFSRGQTSFGRLAQRHQRTVGVFFYVFDVIWVDGRDVRDLPLRARKRILRRVLRVGGPLRLTAHRNRDGEDLYAEACRRGWEGVIAKRADSRYVATRSRDWLKFKCDRTQELVIGGLTAPRGARTELGALLVGYWDDGRLRYAGKVGTGFDASTLRDLGGRLRALERADSPFDEPVKLPPRVVTWVEPELVAQIGFTEWTRHGRLRHPRYLGLRFDKAAREVVREG